MRINFNNLYFFVCETIVVKVLICCALSLAKHVPCQLIGLLPATKLNTTKGSLEQCRHNRYHQSPQVTELDAIFATSRRC